MASHEVLMTKSPSFSALEDFSLSLHIPCTRYDQVPGLVLAPDSSLTWRMLFPYFLGVGPLLTCRARKHLLQPMVLKQANLGESTWSLLLGNSITKEDKTQPINLISYCCNPFRPVAGLFQQCGSLIKGLLKMQE